MSWATVCDTPLKITSATLTTAFGGVKGVMLEKIVARLPNGDAGANTPVCRPMDELDARATIRFQGLDSVKSHVQAAANLVVAFLAGDGGAGSITMGKFVPSGYRIVHDKGSYAECEQDLEMEDTTFTETITL